MEFIESMMENRKLFPDVTDQLRRVGLGQRLRSITHIIPSLHTFFEDMKYLEPCSKIMRGLLPTTWMKAPKSKLKKTKLSIKQAIVKLHTDVGQDPEKVNLEVKDGVYTTTSGDRQYRIECGYRQLWLFAMRHFPELSNVSPRKEQDREKPIIKEPNKYWWYMFAKLALDLGFESAEIRDLCQRDPIRGIIWTCFRQIWPEDYLSIFEEDIESICKKHSQTPPTMDRYSESEIQSMEVYTFDASRRYGIPYELALLTGRKFWFLPELYRLHNGSDTGQLPSSVIQRDVFFAFFGSAIPHQQPHQVNLSKQISEGQNNSGMHSIQSLGGDPEVYDNNAYTINSTYHDGILKMYTTNPTQAANIGNTPKYMTQLRSFAMTDTAETFRQGASAFGNARDWAKEQRDEFVAAANTRAMDMDMDASTLEFSRDNSMQSFSTTEAAALESDTSPDELALDTHAITKPSKKRVKRGPNWRGTGKSHSQSDRHGSEKGDFQSNRRRGPGKSHSKSNRKSTRARSP
jgi:hypothetical protein